MRQGSHHPPRPRESWGPFRYDLGVDLAAGKRKAEKHCDSTVENDGRWACPVAGSLECERCPRRLTMRQAPKLRLDRLSGSHRRHDEPTAGMVQT